MTRIKHLITALLRTGLACGGPQLRRLLADASRTAGGGLIPEVVETIPTPRGDILFYCLDELPLWRARTLLIKEPETIEWIDRFVPGDVYWDVGANIGVYALYAAINRQVRVLAFEPSAANYLLLNRNIEKNGLADHLQAFAIAFSDRTTLDALNMQTTDFGGALSSFAVPVDNDGRTFVPTFRQGMIGFTIDDFIGQFAPPFPNHLKIDVDGIEDRIIVGAAKTLADARLRSLSIELDAGRPDYVLAITERLNAAGLKLVAKRHSSLFDDGKYRNIYNYQFCR